MQILWHCHQLPQALLLAMSLQIQLGKQLVKRIIQPFDPMIPTIYAASRTGLIAFSLLIREFQGFFSLMVSRSCGELVKFLPPIVQTMDFLVFKNKPTQTSLV